jgi:hypothetical protein
MAYFSNGTEGEMYHEQWCSRCLHDNPDAERLCPIWGLHLMRNYDDCNNDNSVLHVLIPRSADKLSNERCTMFVERGLLSNLAIQKFESDSTEGE